MVDTNKELLTLESSQNIHLVGNCQTQFLTAVTGRSAGFAAAAGYCYQ